MMCDIVIAADNAKFGQPEINLGVMPGAGGTQRLARFAGKAKAMDLCLTGRNMDAQEAERAGLVSRVYPNEELLPAALDLAEQMCGYSPHGIAMTKKVLWSNLEAGSLTNAIDLENRNQLLVRLTTQNLEEAIRARREKRKPRYQD
jgi:enoyl-CoA hydratase